MLTFALRATLAPCRFPSVASFLLSPIRRRRKPGRRPLRARRDLLMADYEATV